MATPALFIPQAGKPQLRDESQGEGSVSDTSATEDAPLWIPGCWRSCSGSGWFPQWTLQVLSRSDSTNK